MMLNILKAEQNGFINNLKPSDRGGIDETA
jgi:hypothetical protein